MGDGTGVGDEGQVGVKSRRRILVGTLTDWKVICMSLKYIIHRTPRERVWLIPCIITSISFDMFFPNLTATLGYSQTVTLLLCAPPWVFATQVAFAVTR